MIEEEEEKCSKWVNPAVRTLLVVEDEERVRVGLDDDEGAVAAPVPASTADALNRNRVVGHCLLLHEHGMSRHVLNSKKSPPALPMRIAPGHPASRTPTPTAVTV